MKEKGLAPVFLDSRLEHPAGWICARYKSSVLLLLRMAQFPDTKDDYLYVVNFDSKAFLLCKMFE